MLAHPSPLSLVIDHYGRDVSDITAEEEGVRLTLEHHDRVHCVPLGMPALHVLE